MGASMKSVYDIELVILPGRPDEDQDFVKLYNDIYCYHKKFWENVWIENQTFEKTYSDTFFRQDFIVVAFERGRRSIAGMQLHTKWDLKYEFFLNHTYYHNSFTPEFVETMRQRKATKLLSHECLTVDPSWTKKFTKCSLSSVMVGIGIEVLRALEFDYIIAPARVDNKVTKLVHRWGGESVVKGLVQHNTPVDLIAIPNNSPKCPSVDVKNATLHLWNSREDYTGKFPNIIFEELAA